MRYRHHIKLQEDTSPDGQTDPSYTDWMTGIPCKITPTSGEERFFGNQIQAETTSVIEMRFIEDIDPSFLAVNELTRKKYNIVKVIDVDGMQRKLIIEVVEVAA